MARTDQEVDFALRLREKFKTQGLRRAIDLMEPTEVAMARRVICHALEAFVAPQVSGSGVVRPELTERQLSEGGCD